MLLGYDAQCFVILFDVAQAERALGRGPAAKTNVASVDQSRAVPKPTRNKYRYTAPHIKLSP